MTFPEQQRLCEMQGSWGEKTLLSNPCPLVQRRKIDGVTKTDMVKAEEVWTWRWPAERTVIAWPRSLNHDRCELLGVAIAKKTDISRFGMGGCNAEFGLTVDIAHKRSFYSPVV
jgi:hypothetical protein